MKKGPRTIQRSVRLFTDGPKDWPKGKALNSTALKLRVFGPKVLTGPL